MKIEVSRKVTKHVRGLHLAVLTHNRSGRYHGNGMLVPQAVALAKSGAYSRARAMLRDMRSNGKDRIAPSIERNKQLLSDYAKRHEATISYRFTPNAAQYFGLNTHKVTTKYAEVTLSHSEAKALRKRINEAYKTGHSRQLHTMLDAALNVLGNAGLN